MTGPSTSGISPADWQVVIDVLGREIGRLNTKLDQLREDTRAFDQVDRKVARIARIRGQLIQLRRDQRAGAGR